MNTAACLSRYPWRTLKALAAVYRLPVHHRHSRQQVAQHLSTAIHAHLAETFAALDPDARAALRALAQPDGLSLPRPEFAARFGPLHPYRPWAPQSPPAPWPSPSSPAATLVHYGLAYPLNLGTRERPLQAVVLPRDLRDALAPVLDLPALSEPRSAIPSTAAVGGLEADLCAFLSFLNREDIPVRHGRWLPPRALQALNQYLSPPDDLGPGRSELQATRLPFLHYLAERAGLAGLIGDYLKPALIAQQWLAALRAGRLHTLWEAWLERSAANRTLWLRFRLPALGEDDDPLARFHLLLASLATCPPGPLGHPADLLKALIEQSPALVRPQTTYATWVALSPDEQAGFESRARRVLLALLTGPLTWFGVFVLSTPPLPCSPAPPLPRPSAPLLLTPLGAALLGRDDGAWPAGPAAAPLRIGTLVDQPGAGPAVPLDAPPEVALLDRFALEAIVPPDPAAPGHYVLTRAHFLHALQRGHTVEGTANFLERASGEPLPAPLLGALYRWGEEFERVAVRQVLLLQTRDPALLQALTAERRVRETLGATLNARTVEVRADRLDALLRRLARRSIQPRLDLPRPLAPSPSQGEGWGEGAPSPSQGEGWGEGERAAIAAALRIYAHLADALGLPTRPAHALAHRWSEGLPLPLRDAVAWTVAQALEALHRAAPLEMEDHLPEPTGPLLETLEQAIRECATLEIEYYTAGRAQRTVRRVEPLRLEWHGDVVYLIAYCHLRGEQRVFRVERIGHVIRNP